jgi:hypothetical protein
MDPIASKCIEIFGAWAGSNLYFTGPDMPLMIELFELLKQHYPEQAAKAFSENAFTPGGAYKPFNPTGA